jgi:hypothetical protein
MLQRFQYAYSQEASADRRFLFVRIQPRFHKELPGNFQHFIGPHHEQGSLLEI